MEFYRPRERQRVVHKNEGESRTKESLAPETDIKNIMRKYHETGTQFLNTAQPTYGDFSSATDYFDALNRVMAAQEAFMQLPSEVRTYVENDPGKLLELIFDENRREELDKLGLLSHTEKVRENKAPEPATPPVEETPEVPANPPPAAPEPPTQTPT